MRPRSAVSLGIVIAAWSLVPDDARAQRYKRSGPATQITASQTSQTRLPPPSAATGPSITAEQIVTTKDKPPESDLILADQRFAHGSLADAERLYDKVLASSKTGLHSYARYRKGWIHLNRGKLQDARKALAQVIRKTRASRDQRLYRAARRDFVHAYAIGGTPQGARAAFEQVDRSGAFDMLQTLGTAYLNMGKIADAMHVFRGLIARDPDHRAVCSWQHDVTRGVLAVGSPGDRVKAVERLVARHVLLSANDRFPKPQRDACAVIAEAVTREVATLWHSEALKTLDRGLMRRVADLYRLYLANFSASGQALTIAYYDAELAWSQAAAEPDPRRASGLWERAAGAFTAVAKAGKRTRTQRKQAAYAAALSWKNALAVDSRARPPVAAGRNDTTPRPIPARERGMLDAFELYADLADPGDPEVVTMTFLKGRVLWRYDHLDAAARVFESLVKDFLDHETGEYAVNLLLDTLARLNRYDDVRAWVDVVLANKKFLADKDDLAERLGALKLQVMRRDAEQLEVAATRTGDRRKYDACGRAYLAIYNHDPEARGNDEVLYNAGVCFERARSLSAAVTHFNLVRRLFPRSRVAQRALARLANLYAQVAWYDKAAAALEQYARRYLGERDAVEALGDAIVYRTHLGHDREAIANAEQFVKRYGKKRAREAASVMWNIATIYHQRGDRDKMVKHLRRYLRSYGRKGGIDRQIVAHVRIGVALWESACPVASPDGLCVKRRPAAIAPCGREIAIEAVARDPRKARDAQRELARAIALFRGGKAARNVPGHGGERAQRLAVLHKYINAARFYQAEAGFEQFLAARPPAGIRPAKDGRWRDRDIKRLDAWQAALTGVRDATHAGYADAMRQMSPAGTSESTIAALARQGQIDRYMAYWLSYMAGAAHVGAGKYGARRVHVRAHAPTCERLRAASARNAPDRTRNQRRRALQTQADARRDGAAQRFRACVKMSVDTTLPTDASRACERALDDLLPVNEFSALRELRRAPATAGAIISTELPVLDHVEP